MPVTCTWAVTVADSFAPILGAVNDTLAWGCVRPFAAAEVLVVAALVFWLAAPPPQPPRTTAATAVRGTTRVQLIFSTSVCSERCTRPSRKAPGCQRHRTRPYR